MRRTGTGWQASCGWLPSRYCAATATWVRATGIFAHGLAPPKQSRRWHATWPASSTASSPKVRHGWIAEPNNTSRTAKSVIWPDFRLRPAHVDSASCPPRIKSPEMSLNRSEFLESGREGSPNRSRDRKGALLALPIDLTLPYGRGSDWSTPYARILSIGRHLRRAHLGVAHPQRFP